MRKVFSRTANALGWVLALALTWIALGFGWGAFFGIEEARSGQLLKFILTGGAALLLMASAWARFLGGILTIGGILVGFAVEPTGTVESLWIAVLALSVLTIAAWILGGAASSASRGILEQDSSDPSGERTFATEEDLNKLAIALGAPGLSTLERAVVGAQPEPAASSPAPKHSLRPTSEGSDESSPSHRARPSEPEPSPRPSSAPSTASQPVEPSLLASPAPPLALDRTSSQLLNGYTKTKYTKLGAAVFLDVLGMSTYTLPVIGEFGDLAWGPFAAYCGQMLFKKKKWSLFTLGEEALPFTDAIPSVTMTWYKTYVQDNDASLEAYCREHQDVSQILSKYGSPVQRTPD